MSSEKTMQEEMNEEWMDLAMSNIHKLIPKEWMPRINEILPKILNVAKIGIKKSIKSSAEQLGNTKMLIEMNMPHRLSDNSIMMVPTMFRIDKSQIGASEYDKETGNYEFRLKPGEVPELTFSMLTLAEKINSYNSIEQLIKDIKEGKLFSLEDFNYKVKNISSEDTQKQII